MIICICESGNHSNQLFQFTQLFVLSKEQNLKMVFLPIYKLYPFFPVLKNEYKKHSFFYPLFSFILRILYKIKIIKVYNLLNSSDCEKFVKNIHKKILFVREWSHNNNYILYQGKDLEEKYKDKINKLFKNDCPEIIKKYFPDKNKITIGLHIRRGDYKYYKDGKYYYTDEVYQNAVKSFTENLNLKDFNIIIFTNDKGLDKEFYLKNFKNCFFSNEEFQIDYELMKNCNYLIGAPSSFTMWASYLGNVPLYHIKEKNQAVTRECFKICDGFTS